MNTPISKHLAKIGSRGGRKSRRELDPAQARAMLAGPDFSVSK